MRVVTRKNIFRPNALQEMDERKKTHIDFYLRAPNMRMALNQNENLMHAFLARFRVLLLSSAKYSSVA